MIQPAYSGRVAWCAERSGRRVEYLDFCRVACCWALREEGGSVERWALFIKEETPDDVIEVGLTDMFSEHLERGAWISWGWGWGVSKHFQ